MSLSAQKNLHGYNGLAIQRIVALDIRLRHYMDTPCAVQSKSLLGSLPPPSPGNFEKLSTLKLNVRPFLTALLDAHAFTLYYLYFCQHYKYKVCIRWIF